MKGKKKQKNIAVPENVSKYVIDLTRKLEKKEVAPICGRDPELEKAWFYLSQRERNCVFLLGETDCGKTAIAHEIVRQIIDGECPEDFEGKKVFELKTNRLLKLKGASDEETKEHEKYNKTVKSVMHFLKEHKRDSILFIDKALEMKMDEKLYILLSKCIMKYKIPVITTIEETNFWTYFWLDSSISKYLNYILIEEPELDELEPMIQNVIVKLKEEYHIAISNEMVKFGIYTSVLSNSASSNPGNVINVFRRAFLEAVRKGKGEVDKKCILSCYDSYLKLYNKTTLEEKRIIAYHEVGHYVVSIMSQHVKDEKIAFVSILPMMDFLGVNWPYKVLGENLNYTKNYFLDYIAIYMGGRVSEKIITAEDSTGASADLKAANNIAESMITKYGFSENPNSKNRSFLTDEDALKGYLIYEKKKRAFDEEIQKFIDEGYAIAEKVINENKELIEIIAEKILKEEILAGEELTQIVEEYKRNKK